jgi:hypothetical protein
MKRKPQWLASEINRRDLLKISAGASGALAMGAIGLGAHPFEPQAHAQEGKPSAVVVIFLQGGYNALFGSADSFANRSFGVNNTNMLALSNGLVVDSTFNTLGAYAKANLATAGIAHGIPIHPQAQAAQFTVGAQNPVISLAAALGGSGSIKCVNVGQEEIPGPRNSVNGVSLQKIVNMQTTIDTLGGGAPDPTMPDRAIAAQGIAASHSSSKTEIEGNSNSLSSAVSAYDVAIKTLSKPSQPFNPQTLQMAYGLNGTAITNFNSRIAAAELMIRAGANVVSIVNVGWDTHGDTTGARVRTKFSNEILPGLKTFTDRMLTEQSEYNVTVLILGDFARSLPGSDHATVTVATVMGHNVKQGTTGKVDANVGFLGPTPTVGGFWGFVAAIAGAPKATVDTFGGNQHQSISKV